MEARRKICLAVLLLALSSPGAPAAIRVLSPNGGETWTLGMTYPITWEAPGVEENVKLVLYDGSGRVGLIAGDRSASSGRYLWTAGELQGGTAPAGGGYKVRVVTLSGSLMDASNAPFSLHAGAEPVLQAATPSRQATGAPRAVPVTVTVLEPDGGETFTYGDTLRVRWRSTGAIDRVTVRLDRETPSVYTKAVASNTADDGVEEFAIPAAFRMGGTFKARVFGHAPPDSWVEDASDQAFTILRALELELWPKSIFMLYKKEGTDFYDVIAVIIAPGLLIDESLTYGRCKEKKAKITFRVGNSSGSWPLPSIAVPWRLRIESQDATEILATREGFLQLAPSEPARDHSETIDLGKSTKGVFRCRIEIDPDGTLPVPASLRRGLTAERLFLVKSCPD